VNELINDVVEQEEELVDSHVRLYTTAIISFVSRAFEEIVSEAAVVFEMESS